MSPAPVSEWPASRRSLLLVSQALAHVERGGKGGRMALVLVPHLGMPVQSGWVISASWLGRNFDIIHRKSQEYNAP